MAATNYLNSPPRPRDAGIIQMSSKVELELFGVNRSARYQTVKNQLVDILNRDGLSYSISDIGDIEKFIEIGLDSVPAIRVDKKELFLFPETGDVKATLDAVYDYIVQHKMKAMLIPVDFSPSAENAVRYGVQLAAHLGLRADLMHVYHPVVDPHNAVILDGKMGNTLREQLEKLAAEYKNGSEDKMANPVSSRFEIGFPVQMISETAMDDSVSLVVMGTLGATNLVDQVLGSNSSAVAMRSEKPVLLVPPDVTFKPLDHIVVAFNHELIDSDAFEKLFEFNRPFEAHIDFIHVSDEREDGFAAIRDKLIQRIFMHGTPSFSFDVHEITRGDKGVAHDIQNYADQHHPDLLVMVAQHRSFIDRLFHTSVSKKVCLNPHGPILVLHT